jgi:hypothetical protein
LRGAHHPFGVGIAFATQYGRAYLIEESNLKLVEERNTGRPPKVKNQNK